MPNPPKSSGIRDNHYCGSVGEFLRSHIQGSSRLSIVSAYFTIYAYESLKDRLDCIEHMDFLFGEPSFVKSLDPGKTESKAFIIAQDGLKLANVLQQKRVARECAEWIRQKVDIKSVCQSNFLHGKLYHVKNGGEDVAVLGSSNFTPRGLGLQETGSNIELNLIIQGQGDRDELKAWFDRLWADPDLVSDVKDEVLLYLAQVYQNQTPEFIYYKTLYQIFEKFLGDARRSDEDLGRTTLFDTDIWKALFDFQKDGVKGIINKILTHNGCILADNRSKLEGAGFGLYTVVPTPEQIKTIGPGVIWCLRQKPSAGAFRTEGVKPAEQVNPLQPYFLVYVLNDGNVRLGFAHPKQILGIYREVCAGKTTPCDDLCNLFDHETANGSNTALYDRLLQKAVESIIATFRKRFATGLQSGRGFVIPNQEDQANEASDFELVTWLVIKRP